MIILNLGFGGRHRPLPPPRISLACSTKDQVRGWGRDEEHQERSLVGVTMTKRKTTPDRCATFTSITHSETSHCREPPGDPARATNMVLVPETAGRPFRKWNFLISELIIVPWRKPQVILLPFNYINS